MPRFIRATCAACCLILLGACGGLPESNAEKRERMSLDERTQENWPELVADIKLNFPKANHIRANSHGHEPTTYAFNLGKKVCTGVVTNWGGQRIMASEPYCRKRP